MRSLLLGGMEMRGSRGGRRSRCSASLGGGIPMVKGRSVDVLGSAVLAGQRGEHC